MNPLITNELIPSKLEFLICQIERGKNNREGKCGGKKKEKKLNFRLEETAQIIFHVNMCQYRSRPLTFPPTPPSLSNFPHSPHTNCGIATTSGHKCIRSDSYILSHLTASWHQVYNADPTEGIDDVEQAGLVIGGEAVVWSHFVDSSVLLSTVFPRAAAMGGAVVTLVNELSWRGYCH